MNEDTSPQGSPGWKAKRRGIPTASNFSRVVKPDVGKVAVPKDEAIVFASGGYQPRLNGRPISKTQWSELKASAEKVKAQAKYCYYTGANPVGDEARRGYMAELIAQRLGWEKDTGSWEGSPDIQRGQQLEADVRRWASFNLGEDIDECGFFTSECGRYGGSPDGILRQGGKVIELKCPDLHTYFKWKLSDRDLPLDHKAQVHGEMLVTGLNAAVFIAWPDHESCDPIVVEVERDSYTDELEFLLKGFCTDLDAAFLRVVDDPAYLKGEEAA